MEVTMDNLNTETLRLIEKVVRDRKHIKLTVGVYCDGKFEIRLFQSDGETEDQSYIYEIGSITKVFTTSLMAKYICEGKLDLSNSINHYIHGLDSQRHYPDLRQIATHTAGYSAFLPYNMKGYLNLIIKTLRGKTNDNPLEGKMNIEEMKEVLNQKILADKDYSYQYSNFGISVLGYIVGEIAGCGYYNAMNTFISNDLNLKDTYVGTKEERNLHGYNKKNQDCKYWNWSDDELFLPSGGISSSAYDLLHFAKLNIDDGLPFLSFCHKKYASATKKHDMGLGWELPVNSNILYKDGGTGCFTSLLKIDKNERKAVVVLSNYPVMSIGKIGNLIA